jgi:hypothetical protein
MAKLSLSTIVSSYSSVATINANFAAIAAAIDNTLSRDGTSPNTMSATLDMNSNRLINLASPVNSSDAVRLVDLQSGLGVSTLVIPSQTGNAGKFLGTNGTVVSWQSVVATVAAGSITATELANGAVTYAKMQNVSANSKLLGSSATGAGSPPTELTVGSTLGVTGSTLDVNLASKNAWTGTQKASDQALTSGASSDFTAGQHWTVNVNGSTFTIANPSAVTDKTYIAIYITFTTSNTVAFGANYKNVAQYTPTATAGKTDALLFRVNGSNLELMSYAQDTGKA